MSKYQERVLAHINSLLKSVPRLKSALDFGCGSGWYARELVRCAFVETVIGVDVKRREEMYIEPTIYDGVTLPFQDREFDVVYAIDALHHCPDPIASLSEMARCAKMYLFMKDHVHWNRGQRFLLTALDELGNRRFQVPSPGNYQVAWDWFSFLAEEGFRLRAFQHPLPCNGWLLDPLCAPLQFLALWSRD